MPVIEAVKQSKRWWKLLDIVMSGEAAHMCGFIDGRTFLKAAKKNNVEPIGFWGKKAVFNKSDVLKLAAKLKKDKKKEPF